MAQSGNSAQGGCYNCWKSGHTARTCHNPKVEVCGCNRCGSKGHLTSQRRAPAREIAEEEDLLWGACVIDEVQDVDAAGRVMNEKERLDTLKEIRYQSRSLQSRPGINPILKMKIQDGHRARFFLDRGAVKTSIPKDVIPGMKPIKSKGGSFRVASGEVMPNVGAAKMIGVGTLSKRPLQIIGQVAEITKPGASVDKWPEVV